MIDFFLPFYDWFKVGHIASVISWMAGMFYLPRLFVNHAERAKVGSEMDQAFCEMEEKLLRIIMRPAMMASWGFGIILILLGGFDWSAAWAWIKLASVIVMTGTHIWLKKRHADFAAGRNMRTGRTFRIVNEIPTVLMLIIVVAVVVRPF